jgi:DNA-binding beta-propeller fold protein YncE
MSVVYLAEDLRLKRKVALKLLAPALAEDEAFRERFLVESELAASLDHPNIVPIYAAGDASEQLFIAMRYVEGNDLKQLLRDGPLSVERTIEVCGQVAQALDFAHERGLVHRDVKPSNVLLDARGHVYLTDFGLTKRLAEPRMVEPGLFGTIDYVAPEQIRGDGVDRRADVYSLGCLLCECLTGEPPFRRATEAAALFAHLEEEPQAPAGLEPVVPKALAKEPRDRYGTCAELVGAAREALGLGEPEPKWWRSPVTLTLAVVLATIALVVVLAVGVSGPGEVAGALFRIDPRTNRVVAQVADGNDPRAVAADASSVWVANHDRTVWRVDAHTNRVISRSPAYGVPADVAILPADTVACCNGSPANAVVVNGPSDPGVVEINAASGATTVFRLASRGPDLGGDASAATGALRVAAGPAGIWVARPDRQVGRFNVNTGRLVLPLFIAPPRDERGDSYFSGIAVGAGGVWVLGDGNDRVLWRIDPATARLAATVALPFVPTDVAVGDGAVWVTSALANTLARIDPSTDRITAAIPTGKGAAAVAVGAGSVWVAGQVDDTITRIDPRTLRLIRTIKLDCGCTHWFPVDLAVADGAVWVVVHQ